MSDRSSAVRAASVRDWVETTLNGDTLHTLTRDQMPFRTLDNVYDSSRELRDGLVATELETIPDEFLHIFK